MSRPDPKRLSQQGADDGAINRLTASSPVELPSEYLLFLRQSNGGEGPLPVQPFYFHACSAGDVALTMEQKRHEEFFPGFIMIGSNGGGEYVAFDIRESAPWPVVAIDMTNINLAESVQEIAPNFSAFSEMIGKEEGTS